MGWVGLGVDRPFIKRGESNPTIPPKKSKKSIPFSGTIHLEGSTDPFLRVDLTQGDMIHAESGHGEHELDVGTGGRLGGMPSGLMRKALSEEFSQEISAEQGPGTVRRPRRPRRSSGDRHGQ